MKRSGLGTIVALFSVAALTCAMLPFRGHLSTATTALVMVVPVVIGVVAGGFIAGAFGVIAGFLAWDVFFIRPYGSLRVKDAQNWLALGVYVVVMLLVAHVVAGMHEARAKAQRQSGEIRQLFELSDLLVADKSLDVLLSVIATTLADVFGARQVALFLPQGDDLKVVAAAGEPLSEAQVHRVLPAPGELARFGARPSERDGLLVVALATAGRPVGLLVLSADTAARHEREPLQVFANQIALAVERAQLREQVIRTRLTEEVSRLAKTLVAAVSHDLRGPLATIKAASSTLADAELDLSPESTRKLAQLIDVQADRLAELVKNLLDMSRIQAGVLQPSYSIASLRDVVTNVVRDLHPALRGQSVDIDVPGDLPAVRVDLVLISRVLTNLLENAVRYSPKEAPITISATLRAQESIEVSVTDRGPGVSPDRRNEVFELFARRPGDSGAGLGLTIAKTFVEAHGQHIWLDDATGGGAKFSFTVPVAPPTPEESRVAADTHH
jgi:two-component system sensor histidine kinase KdpD